MLSPIRLCIVCLLLTCCGPQSDPRGDEAATLRAQNSGTDLTRSTEAGPLVIPRTEQFWLPSENTKVRYRLEVALPNTYAEGAGTYPVILLLDTHYSFLIARNITDHLSERNHLPEVVVVGIGYRGAVDRASPEYRNNRSRDYTPIFDPDDGYGPEHQKHSGGAPAFVAFLEHELIPELESRYRLKPGDRTLVGHSFGGLFVTYAKLHRPEFFPRILSVSPSLWYHDWWSFKNEASYFEKRRDLPGRLYMTVGSRERNNHDMVDDLNRFGKLLESRSYEGLELRYEVLDNETHNSVFPRALSNGLRFLFDSP